MRFHDVGSSKLIKNRGKDRGKRKGFETAREVNVSPILQERAARSWRSYSPPGHYSIVRTKKNNSRGHSPVSRTSSV